MSAIKNKNITRIIFDKDFYLVQAILKSKKFIIQRQILKDKLKAIGKPIPDNGFKTPVEYFKWTKQGNVLTHFHSLIDDLIRSFGIKNIKKEIHDAIFYSIFFNLDHAPLRPTHGAGIKLEPGKNRGILKLIIYPWTIDKDVEEDVKKSIKQIKALLKSSYKKNKEWENFNRDYSIYELYQKICKENNNKITYKEIKDNPEYQRILDRYGKISNNEFSQILLRCKSIFDKTSFI